MEFIQQEILAWQNNKYSTINWQFTTQESRVNLEGFTHQLMINLTLAYK